ncbi:hypothetical protein SBRY_90206 [Actinacidiphila bryophytorum]|uniref:Uncharacterized protein n=1 Tax=Actinacidiphila bryophytorum TaxID=1436133 RepID=A0A9W4H8R0_9ACTN|nr:hypothetical protein SBRY_90206 [Actinacidiphila bryophytorum]
MRCAGGVGAAGRVPCRGRGPPDRLGAGHQRGAAHLGAVADLHRGRTPGALGAAAHRRHRQPPALAAAGGRRRPAGQRPGDGDRAPPDRGVRRQPPGHTDRHGRQDRVDHASVGGPGRLNRCPGRLNRRLERRPRRCRTGKSPSVPGSRGLHRTLTSQRPAGRRVFGSREPVAGLFASLHQLLTHP